MKFSVKTLLVLILLLSLAINAGIKLSQFISLNQQQAQLQAKKSSWAPQCINFESRKAIYNRAFDAVQKRQEHFEVALADFEVLAEKQSQITVTDPTQAYIAHIPTHDSHKGSHYRFRIWLPETTSFQLQLGFSPDENTASLSSLDKSRFFQSASRTTISLPKGESVIGAKWIDGHTRNIFRLHVNGQMVHELISNHELWNNRSHLSSVVNETPCDFFKVGFEKDDGESEFLCLRLTASRVEEKGQGK